PLWVAGSWIWKGLGKVPRKRCQLPTSQVHCERSLTCRASSATVTSGAAAGSGGGEAEADAGAGADAGADAGTDAGAGARAEAGGAEAGAGAEAGGDGGGAQPRSRAAAHESRRSAWRFME